MSFGMPHAPCLWSKGVKYDGEALLIIDDNPGMPVLMRRLSGRRHLISSFISSSRILKFGRRTAYKQSAAF